MTFSEKLITLRAGRGWSQEKLAEALGVTRQAVGRWEKGAGLPDAVGLTNLARVFDVDAEWLLDEAATKPEPRRIRRVKLMWYDWLMPALAICAVAAYTPLAGYAYEMTLRNDYSIAVLIRAMMAMCVCFPAGWFAAALLSRFALGRFPRTRRAKRAVIAVGAALMALMSVAVLFICALYLRVLTVDPGGSMPDLIYKLMVPIYQNPALFFLPGLALSLCAPRRAK